jgi:hypothetical protein
MDVDGAPDSPRLGKQAREVIQQSTFKKSELEPQLKPELVKEVEEQLRTVNLSRLRIWQKNTS